MSKAKDKAAELSFEAALQRLEEIVESLEDGNLPLEEAIAAFEEGTGLRKICQGRLKDAEKKIEILLRDEDGQLGTAPLEDDSDAGEASQG